MLNMTNPPSMSGVKMANRPPVKDSTTWVPSEPLPERGGTVPASPGHGQARACVVVGDGVARAVDMLHHVMAGVGADDLGHEAESHPFCEPGGVHRSSQEGGDAGHEQRAQYGQQEHSGPRGAESQQQAEANRRQPGQCPEPTFVLHNNSRSLVAMSQERRSKGSVSSSVSGCATSWRVFNPGTGSIPALIAAERSGDPLEKNPARYEPRLIPLGSRNSTSAGPAQ